ncbi:hypothetical protein ACJX0J_021643 [Zea mays]
MHLSPNAAAAAAIPAADGGLVSERARWFALIKFFFIIQATLFNSSMYYNIHTIFLWQQLAAAAVVYRMILIKFDFLNFVACCVVVAVHTKPADDGIKESRAA